MLFLSYFGVIFSGAFVYTLMRIMGIYQMQVRGYKASVQVAGSRFRSAEFKQEFHEAFGQYFWIQPFAIIIRFFIVLFTAIILSRNPVLVDFITAKTLGLVFDIAQLQEYELLTCFFIGFASDSLLEMLNKLRIKALNGFLKNK